VQDYAWVFVDLVLAKVSQRGEYYSNLGNSFVKSSRKTLQNRKISRERAEG
jgi:hypothetical protein